MKKVQARSNSKYEKGSTLLIALILTFVFLSIGIAVSNFSNRGLELTQSARESAYALYAADSGIECSLYHDLVENDFFSNASSNDDVDINCGNGIIRAEYFEPDNTVGNGNCDRFDSSFDWCYQFVFSVEGGASGQEYDSLVQFAYDASSGGEVTIVSQGYNSDTYRLTRQREITYTYSL